ncbi:HAMP domain-containing protein, partial [Frankia sp. Cpl3]|nr:HAMP domain-containing protein [Frankia sp. Cpl3]
MSADASPDRQQSPVRTGDSGGPQNGSTATLPAGDATNGSVEAASNGPASGAGGAGGLAVAAAGNAVSGGVDTLLPALLAGLDQLVEGDFGARLPICDGIGGDVARRFNELAGMQERQAREVTKVSKVIRRDGRLTMRMDDLGGSGGWDELTQSVNSLIDDLGRPTHEVARVIAAVAEGDLSQQMALEIAGQPVRGEFLRIGTTVNTMVDQL